MDLKKIALKAIDKIKSHPVFDKYKPEVIGRARYYKINNYRARVEFDEDLNMYVGSFDELNGMTCFFTYYEADIRSTAAQSLRTYLKYCEDNGLDPRGF